MNDNEKYSIENKAYNKYSHVARMGILWAVSSALLELRKKYSSSPVIDFLQDDAKIYIEAEREEETIADRLFKGEERDFYKYTSGK